MRFNLGPYDRIVIRGIAYRVHASTAAGHVLERVDQPGLCDDFTDDGIAAESQRPDYRFDRDWFSPQLAHARLLSGVHGFEDIPPAEMPEIFWREKWCMRFLRGEDAGEFSRSDAGWIAAVRTIVAEFALDRGGKGKKRAGAIQDEVSRDPPSGKTLRRWVRRLELGGFCATALRKAYHRSGNFGSRVHPDIDRLLRRHAVDYASETRPTKNGCYRNMRAAVDTLNTARVQAGIEPLRCPAYETFNARVEDLDAFDVCVARMGLAFARQKFRILGTGLAVTRAGERVEMDEWSVQLQTLLNETGLWHVLDADTQDRVRELRVWVCVALDAASRCVLGMSVSRNQSTASAISTLRMVVTDKAPYADHVGALAPWEMACTPEAVVTDAGSTLINDAFKSRVAALRIRPHTAPAGRPTLRARVERFFGTVHTQLISRFSGRSFENPVVKGDYDSEARASLSVDGLCEALVRYVVDVYHQQPHEGLKGETPAAAWRRLTSTMGVKPPPGKDIVRHVFGVELQPLTGPHGVRVLHLNYTSLVLQEYRRSVSDGPVRIRVDPYDLGRVSVLLHDDWHVLQCTTPGLDGVSFQDWKDTLDNLHIRHAAGAKLTEPVVLQAIRDIEKIATRSMDQHGLLKTQVTEDAIRNAERDLSIGFRLPESGVEASEPADAENDILDGSIEGTGPEAEVRSPATMPTFRITGLDDE